MAKRLEVNVEKLERILYLWFIGSNYKTFEEYRKKELKYTRYFIDKKKGSITYNTYKKINDAWLPIEDALLSIE